MVAVGRLAALNPSCDCCFDIRQLLAKASEKWLSVLFHPARRIVTNCVLVSLHLIEKACTKPIQILIGETVTFSVGSFNMHWQRYARPNPYPQLE